MIHSLSGCQDARTKKGAPEGAPSSSLSDLGLIYCARYDRPSPTDCRLPAVPAGVAVLSPCRRW